MRKIAPFAGVLPIACSGPEVHRRAVKPLIEAVYASGFVVARNEYDVISQAEGYFAAAIVKVGEKVKGDPILRIEGRQGKRAIGAVEMSDDRITVTRSK